MSGAKFDPAYSFRSSEALRQQAEGRRTRRPAPPPDADDGDRQDCAQGSWCHGATRDAEGNWHPAQTFQAFCPACRATISNRVADLPEACVRMLIQIGERPRLGKAVRMPAGPRIPIRLEIDTLVREMAFILGSWHERVAALDRLVPPDMQAAVHRPAQAVDDAVRVLQPRIDALLSLQPEPMVRFFYRPKDAEARITEDDPRKPWSALGEDGRVLRSGEAYLLPSLGGIAAGKEILDLHHRMRKVTGQVRGRPETFDGIPCRGCESMSLERAEPPSNPDLPSDHSRCAGCGDTMSKKTFDDWVAYYQAWAKAATGLTCRRCQNGNHDGCQWAACSCRASAHVASGVAALQAA